MSLHTNNSTKYKVLEKTLEEIYSFELDALTNKKFKKKEKELLLMNLNNLIIELQLIQLTNYKDFISILKSIRDIIYEIYFLNHEPSNIIKYSINEAFELLDLFTLNDNLNQINPKLIILTLLKLEKSLLCNESIEDNFKQIESYYLTLMTINVFEFKNQRVNSILEDLKNDR